MAGNSFGTIFRLTTFGESHGKGIGGVIDGCPSNVELNLEEVQHQLDRRRPGQSEVSTQRAESDTVQFYSGILDGKTLGTPIGFFIPNKDQQSEDYDELRDVFRPSHADFTYQSKYGIRDHRGGGRSSARETACRVVAGAIASQILNQLGIKITAYVQQVGPIAIEAPYSDLDLSKIDSNEIRCPDVVTAEKMKELILQTKEEGDSLGGVIQCIVQGTPVGLGAPVFDRLEADLAKAMLSINAVKGFEIGSGFAGIKLKGSEHNDSFIIEAGEIGTTTNNSGGVQGGISNGEDIVFKVAFKPTATISKSQKTVNMAGEEVDLEAKGRHDPCVVPRAVPIVESMAAITLLDHYLRQRAVGL